MARQPNRHGHADEERAAVDGEQPARFIGGETQRTGHIGKDQVDAVERVELHAGGQRKSEEQPPGVARRYES
jgi:hypothetical protein